MSARIYHDEDVEPRVLSGERIGVIGYGNQGRSQALNLRDSGLDVRVGGQRDTTLARAAAEGFATGDVAATVSDSDVVLMLIPDEVMPEVFEKEVRPQLRVGACLGFASAYNVAFGLLEPPDHADVVMVAPRMIGPGVRDRYREGRGFPSFVGVHQDATGTAKARMLALARALGSTRAGCLELSFADEAALDLFTEQGFGPAFGCALQHAIATLVDAGFPPEAVLLELYMSGELGYSFDRIAQEGMLAQHEHHSHTSQYGSLSRGARFIDLDFRPRMEKVLDEIRSGAFAREWSHEQESGQPRYQALKAAREKVPLTKWEREARRAFRMDE